jgi:hypothetical protein
MIVLLWVVFGVCQIGISQWVVNRGKQGVLSFKEVAAVYGLLALSAISTLVMVVTSVGMCRV